MSGFIVSLTAEIFSLIISAFLALTSHSCSSALFKRTNIQSSIELFLLNKFSLETMLPLISFFKFLLVFLFRKD